MFPAKFFPATCELCGHWIPKHAGDCPRNGVHPSQWSLFPSLDDTNPNNAAIHLEYGIDVYPFTNQPAEVDPTAYYTT